MWIPSNPGNLPSAANVFLGFATIRFFRKTLIMRHSVVHCSDSLHNKYKGAAVQTTLYLKSQQTQALTSLLVWRAPPADTVTDNDAAHARKHTCHGKDERLQYCHTVSVNMSVTAYQRLLHVAC